MASGLVTFVKNIIHKKQVEKAVNTGTALTNAGVTTTTPKTTGGVYVTNTGTVAVNKTGSITVTPTKVTSHGGGGSSYTPTTQTVQQQNIQSALDIPPQSNAPMNIVKPAVVTTGVRNAYNYFKQNLGRESALNLFRGTGQIAFGKKTGGLREQIANAREEKLKRDVAKAEGTWGGSQADINKAYKGYSGTSSNYSYTQTPDNVLIRNAALGDQPSLIALADRMNKNIEVQAKVLATNIGNDNQAILDSYTTTIQNKINSGEITYKQGVEYVNTKADILNKEGSKTVEDRLKPLTKDSQTLLDKTARAGRITRVVITTASSLVAGAVLAPAIAVTPKAIQTGGLILGGVGMYKPVKRVTTGLIVGTTTGLDVAELVIPTAGFIAGGAIGMKIFKVGGSVKPNPKLDIALQTAELKSVSSKVLTSESQIKALRITELQKVELIKQLNMGESIGTRTWRIKARTPKLQKVIDEGLPQYEIVSTGRTATLNNAYASKTIVKVKVGEGKTQFIDLTSGDTIGFYSPKTKLLYTETLSQTAELNKPVREVVKSFAVTKPTIKNIFDEGQFKRLVGTKSYSFEGAKIKAPQGKQITYKDLMEVVKSERVKKHPTSYAESLELQKATSANEVNALMGIEGEGKGFGFNKIDIKFVTEKGVDVLKNLEKPIEYEKFISKKMKPLTYEDLTKTPKKIEPINQIESGTKEGKVQELSSLKKELEVIKTFKRNTKSIPQRITEMEQGKSLNKMKQEAIQLENKDIQKLEQDLDLGSIQALDFNINQIKQSLKTGAVKTAKVLKPKTFISPLSKSKVQLTNKQINDLSESSFNNILDLDYNQLTKQVRGNQIVINKEKNKNRNRRNLNILPVQIPILTPTQVDKLLSGQAVTQKQKQRVIQTPKLQTKQLQTYKPYIPYPTIPNINKPIIPIPLPFGQGVGQQIVNKFVRRNKKPNPKYTASLSSAAFETKPLKVTKQQIERLNKVVFTGAEIRPTLQLISDKEMAKVLKKVNF